MSFYVVIGLNRQTSAMMNVERELVIVAGATHLFEEPGALAEAARLSYTWFQRYLGKQVQSQSATNTTV